MNKLEKKYTSTGSGLLQHLDTLKSIQNGDWKPIELTLAPTDFCNLNCSFCSVKNREMDILDFEELKKVLRKFRDIGLQSVAISGGGDPLLYSYINELIDYIHYWDMDVGLITNGIKLNKIKKDTMKKLTWIRISLNGLDYIKDINFNFDIPENVDIGLSYVWNENTTKDIIKKVENISKKLKVKFVRIVPDCLSVEKQKKYDKEIKESIKNNSVFFYQQKTRSLCEKCFVGYIKPYLCPDGYIYSCTAHPLLKRKVDKKFRLGHMNDVKKIWKNVKPLNPKLLGCEAGKCFFKEQNDILNEVIQNKRHKKFV
jgi:MoaA/NifB/PqqE/SkfB family radical SAM enzyme